MAPFAAALALVAHTALAAPYTSAEHQFRVDFGGTPTVSSKDSETKGVKYTTTQYRFPVSDELELAVAVTPFPPDLIASSKPQVLLKGGQDGSLRGMNAELVRDEETTQNGWPARRFWAKNADGLSFVIKLVMMDNLQYSVIAAHGRGQEKKAEAFSASFALTKDAPPQSDQSFLLETADFRVKFPRKPELKEGPLETQAGTITQHTYTASAPSLVTMLMWVDYPGTINRQGALDGAKNGMGKAPNKILSEKPIKLSGHEGYDLQIEGQGQQKFLARVFVVGNRLYQVLAVAQPDRGEDGNARAFIDSFGLVGTTKAASGKAKKKSK